MILLTHIIFIDNNNSFSRWRNSFNSIINNLPNNKNNIDLLLSGYVSERFIKLVDSIINDNRKRN